MLHLLVLDCGPSKAVLEVAAKDDGLQAYCSKKTDDTRTLARKGLMAITYLFGEKHYKPELNGTFWQDISVTGMAMAYDRKRLVGVLLGGEMVSAGLGESYVGQGQG